jgi:hypothetical protein
MAEKEAQKSGGNEDEGLKSSQPAPLTAPINGAGTPIGPREPSTKNDGK